MREIKFRAWEKDVKVILTHEEMNIDECLKDSNVIVMQYTGLKDKNGKEIYEGDVYNYNGVIDVFESIEDFYYNELIKYRVEDGEIIGNIYENPELINNNK